MAGGLKLLKNSLPKKNSLITSYSARFLLICFLGGVFYFLLPKPLFRVPYSTLLLDKEGILLSARLATDMQWRFPPQQNIPENFSSSLLAYEDEYFNWHPGFNPFSIYHALEANLRNKKIVRGGSTLSMQTVRLWRNKKKRGWADKLIEVFLAIRLECTYSKKEILALYASHAPFGGNVVGLEAASWRYFGRPPHKLSWAEAASLAVLPNAPALVYPGRNSKRFLAKRNDLLNKLHKKGRLDQDELDLSLSEPLPGKPHPLPYTSPHLLDRALKEGSRGKSIHTTLNVKMQEDLNQTISQYYSVLRQNHIVNAAALIIHVPTGAVLAYTGNTPCREEECGQNVDIIRAPRSTGSILKPFLYTSLLQEGKLLPQTLLTDIPTHIAGYSPQNFEETFDGAVPAGNALARSLNIPFVRLLQKYGVDKFHQSLKQMDLSHITKPADHYGLSLILGGAEASLWDLSRNYLYMAQTLLHTPHVNVNDLKAPHYIQAPPSLFLQNPHPVSQEPKALLFDPAALWWTFEALSTLNRPPQEAGWQEFTSSGKIAWKTGTSFGHKDAWAIGVTPHFLVGVWVGNANGEGRPGLTGVSVAGPILFNIFRKLHRPGWFKQPYTSQKPTTVCLHSGYKAGPFCEKQKTLLLPIQAEQSAVCPFHKIIHLDQSGQNRVNSECYPVSQMKSKAFFILPPAQDEYYRKKNYFYKSLPPLLKGCYNTDHRVMEVIYPQDYSHIFLPRGFDGTPEKTVFEIAHRDKESQIYWHLDGVYIATTQEKHKYSLNTHPGKHTLVLVDDKGEKLSLKFEVLSR